MRKEPLRFVSHYLTMDYVNREQKMREIEAQIRKSQPISRPELLAYWVVLGIFITCILLSW